MTQILKRLEIIQSSIAIEDEEIIELQIIKLKKIDIDEEVKNIFKYLENRDFSTAIKLIENYLSKYSGIVEYIDPQIQGLKLELKSLEEKLQNLAIEKTEYLKDIEEFNIQYNIHLGDIIKSILSLKKEILYKKTINYQKIKDTYEEEIKTFDETKDTITELKQTISELEEALENIDKDDENYDEIYKACQELQEELENLEDELYSQEQKLDETKEQLEDDELFNEYEDVKSAYEEFDNEYEHIKDNQKDTIKLNDDEKDITKVKEILLKLETGTSFEVSSNSIEDKEILKAKIEEFKKTIQELKNKIEEIKSDDTFVTISSLDDWDIYFEGLKKDLEEEKEKLEVEAQEILKEKKEFSINEKKFYSNKFGEILLGINNVNSLQYLDNRLYLTTIYNGDIYIDSYNNETDLGEDFAWYSNELNSDTIAAVVIKNERLITYQETSNEYNKLLSRHNLLYNHQKNKEIIESLEIFEDKDSSIKPNENYSTFSKKEKKESLLSSLGESITNGINTFNSGIHTCRETLELTRNVLQDAIEQSKLDLINTKKKAVVTYQELGFSVEDISKELDWDIDIIQNILKEQTVDSKSCISTIKYLSTSEIARQHNMQAKPHLFDELLELKLLYKDNKSYKLTDKGKKIGGNYKSSDKGEEWVVWEENSLNKIIEDLKIKLGLNSSEIQKKI